VLDNGSEGHEKAWEGPVSRIELEDRAKVLAQVPPGPWDAMIHFAARCYVGESMREPLRYWRANLSPLFNLLEALPNIPVVFSSTCATFGLPRQAQLDETHPQEPVNPYGATKLAAERLLKDRDQAGQGQYAILRYFNAAGAAEGYGEDHRPETHLIPLAISAALGKREPLTVFGTDYDTPDGTCVRDYIHISDLADAHLKALHWLLAERGSNDWNLGTGRGASVKEVLKAVEAGLGTPVPHTEGPRRPGDPPQLVASPEKARSELNWIPTYSHVEEIVKTAIQWHQEFPEGYDSKV